MRPLPSQRHDAALRAATSYKRVVTVRLTRGEQELFVVPTSLSITQDSRTNQRWSGSMEIAVDPYDSAPLEPSHILTPFGTRVDVQLGLELSDGSQSSVNYGSFLLSSSQTRLSTDSRIVSLDLSDISVRVADHRFEYPFPVAAGTDLADMVEQVVNDREPRVDTSGLTQAGTDLDREVIFGLSSGTDPWTELNDVLTAYGFRAWFDRDGRVVVDQIPTEAPVFRPIAATELSSSFTDRPYNVVVARGGSMSANATVSYGVWEDTDPSSPTRVTGPYGRVTHFYSSPQLATNNQAEAAARRIGMERKSAGAAWDVVRTYDPTFDPDDGLTAALPDGNVINLVIEQVALDVNGVTSMQAHQWTPDDPTSAEADPGPDPGADPGPGG